MRLKAVSRENVRVEVGRTIDLDGTLEIGTVEETLTVSAGAPVVDSLDAGSILPDVILSSRSLAFCLPIHLHLTRRASAPKARVKLPMSSF